MRLWKRVSGVLKDQNSLWITSLARRSTFRNPYIEAAVIKATSHDEFYVDYDNHHRVYTWLRLSESNIKPLVWCITTRIERTRSWIVVLKGLMLLHGVFSLNLSVIQRVGRLPFDLSNFKDGHSELGKTWAHNAFVRAYYAYLDQKSVLLFTNLQERRKVMRKESLEERSLMQDLLLLQRVQGLLDLLLQIKPQAQAAYVYLIVEAMECVVFEVFNIYGRVCSMVADVLKRIEYAAKAEAAMILRIVQKAVMQGDELALFLEFCREIGVRNASVCPDIPQVPEEDIQVLDRMVNGASEESEIDQLSQPSKEEKAIVVRETKTGDQRDDNTRGLKTIITNHWEQFDEDLIIFGSETSSAASELNPFLALSAYPCLHEHPKFQEMPDLISF